MYPRYTFKIKYRKKMTPKIVLPQMFFVISVSPYTCIKINLHIVSDVYFTGYTIICYLSVCLVNNTAKGHSSLQQSRFSGWV